MRCKEPKKGGDVVCYNFVEIPDQYLFKLCNISSSSASSSSSFPLAYFDALGKPKKLKHTPPSDNVIAVKPPGLHCLIVDAKASARN